MLYKETIDKLYNISTQQCRVRNAADHEMMQADKEALAFQLRLTLTVLKQTINADKDAALRYIDHMVDVINDIDSIYSEYNHNKIAEAQRVLFEYMLDYDDSKKTRKHDSFLDEIHRLTK